MRKYKVHIMYIYALCSMRYLCYFFFNYSKIIFTFEVKLKYWLLKEVSFQHLTSF